MQYHEKKHSLTFRCCRINTIWPLVLFSLFCLCAFWILHCVQLRCCPASGRSIPLGDSNTQSPPPESMLSPQQFGVRRGFHFCLHQISWSLVFSSMGPRRMAAGIVKTPGQPPVRHAPIFTVCCCWTRGGCTQVKHFLEVPISLHESYHNNSFSSLCSARSCYLWGLQCLTSHFSSLITTMIVLTVSGFNFFFNPTTEYLSVSIHLHSKKIAN